ncbi:DnaB-like helicase C-terminal domain-containing protein [Amycolatopsis cihanbeyliensis]|uniref:AAA domain-containing protein n=1 Tax=Amycolatopsis cihanbeyliensis TaxID=1128664 RepID=A0A542DNJ6_AMYCI|nr:DnaB-like helicase C-terminal domain-containing protein [Amycolatopsis cihanbeyliensis]TQJ04663.1 AAA domain-containing protein [Amycolatopsis cihanbeyliensis]
MRVRGSGGDPLPAVYRSLERKQIHFIRGQLILICAGPGTGKSAVTLDYALKSKVSALYFSADSDAFVQLTRSVSSIMSWSMAKSAAAVRANDLGVVRERLMGAPIRFNYSASPSLDEIKTTMEAYEELYGDFPELVIVDNVTNVWTSDGDGDPFAGLEGLMDYLHGMARDTESCVIGLHHVTGDYVDAAKPIPLSGVKGQITRVPEVVVTIHKQPGDGYNPDLLRVAPVKNRNGKADSSGQDYAELEFLGDTMTIRDPELGESPFEQDGTMPLDDQRRVFEEAHALV